MSSEFIDNPPFRANDLPIIPILHNFLSSSGSDSSEAEIVEPTPSSPVSLPPSTESIQHDAAANEFSFSEIIPQILAQPKPKRVYKKKYPNRFRKGIGGTKRAGIQLPTIAKKVAISGSSSSLLKETKFPRPPVGYKVNLKEGDKITSKTMSVPHGVEMMNMDILCEVIGLLRCTDLNCRGRLRLHKLPNLDGLQSFFVLHCQYCHNVIAKFGSSLHLGESPSEAVNNPRMLLRRPSEVNIRSLLGVHLTSMSWQDFLLFCALMDLPVPGLNMRKSYLNKMVSATSSVCEKSMASTAKEVRERKDTEPSNIPGAFRCNVSFDGSWHQRGHYSNQGFAAAIDSDSGKVLDYILYQRVCRKCSKWPEERRNNNPDEYSAFWEVHKGECPANFSGTSQGMEGSAALEIWKRSVDKNGLVYSTYIGDGDSSAFKKVSDADPYNGLERIRKEECLGHVQKRLKKHLKENSATSKAIGVLKAERVGQLYALAVLQNRGKTPDDIRQALWNLLDHLIESHGNCPYSKESWCYYQSSLAENAEDPSFPIATLRKPYLTDLEFVRAKEVFEVYASNSICAALTMGKTQNANESLHSIIWHNSPKGKYVGQKSMQASTSLAVLTFNEGNMALAAVLNAFSINSSYSTLLHLTRRDRQRNRNREYALSSARRRRRQLATRILTVESSRRRLEKSSIYDSGKFGTENIADNISEDSDTVCCRCGLINCPTGRKGKSDEWVGCEICQDWFHAKCVGLKEKSLGEDPYFCDACN